jgi:hypothetical protein
MDDVIRPRTRPEGLSVSALEIFWGWELDGREFPVPGHGYPEQDLRPLLRSYGRRPPSVSLGEGIGGKTHHDREHADTETQNTLS